MSNRDAHDLAGARRIRLAAFDLDGTLLGPDLTIGEAAVAAIGRLAAEGVVILIVTGRLHPTAERYARQLGLEGQMLVSCNGAMVKRVGGDEVWWYRPIETPVAAEVLAFLASRDLHPLVFDFDRVYAQEPTLVSEQYHRISGLAPSYVGNLLDFVTGAGTSGGKENAPSVPPPTEPVRPTKILQVHAPELMPALHAEAQARFGRTLYVTTSYSFFLEFMNRSAGKGPALAEVCRRLGLESRDVAAFGDGLNDLDMIRWAGLGVALGHGPPELLAAADVVLAGPPGESVARFIEDNLLDRKTPRP